VISRLKTTILCVDDNWSGLISRKMLLESNGYEVLEATGGDEGLKLFLSRSVDAVVIDYQMPGMNGNVVAAKMSVLSPTSRSCCYPTTGHCRRANWRRWMFSCPNQSRPRFSYRSFSICLSAGPDRSLTVGSIRGEVAMKE